MKPEKKKQLPVQALLLALLRIFFFETQHTNLYPTNRLPLAIITDSIHINTATFSLQVGI
jgi:hypothetical protein